MLARELLKRQTNDGKHAWICDLGRKDLTMRVWADSKLETFQSDAIMEDDAVDYMIDDGYQTATAVVELYCEDFGENDSEDVLDMFIEGVDEAVSFSQ